MNNLEKAKCCTCGYEWYKGQDGSHTCSAYLLRRINTLEVGLKELISVAEDCDGWDSFPASALHYANEALDT